ncbi:MAG TPA: septal ring lytic transglycosylase RlpA family protein [Devosia sp.]|nr:septal ring lytic transglycosylase RlpA family protein [Devosia sp.]
MSSRTFRLMAMVLLLAPVIAACATNHSGVKRKAFTSREFGVAVSPRVTTMKYPPHGGGRYLTNQTYKVRGVTYQTVDGPGYVATGEASWYGQDFHGRRTANGEIFGAYYLTAASPVLPIPSYARVTNLENGRSVLVRVNDRGPYMQGRVADVSYQTASVLGFVNKGSAQIQIAYVGPAPLNGDDNRMLMASLNTTTRIEQQGDTRIALADTPAPMPRATRAAPHRDPFSGGLVGDIIGLFGYAEAPSSDSVNAAVDAATAMATRAEALDAWKASVDDDARRINLGLGTFEDPVAAISVAESFAMLGAVDEDQVDVNGRRATRLTLTHLKPGVARADVVSLAHELGLTDVVLY